MTDCIDHLTLLRFLMSLGGVEIDQFCQICLILEAKFRDDHCLKQNLGMIIKYVCILML